MSFKGLGHKNLGQETVRKEKRESGIGGKLVFLYLQLNSLI